jgi:predicted DNA-binding transcriptional regulator AlpA
MTDNPKTTRPMLTSNELRAYLKISESHFHTLRRTRDKNLPKPVGATGSPRWFPDEIDAWLNASRKAY